MDPNILLTSAPSTVKVGGFSVDINTSWRTGVKVMQAIEDVNLSEKDQQLALLMLYFGFQSESKVALRKPAVEHPDEAIEAALLFFNFNEPKQPKSPTVAAPDSSAVFRSWDWDLDAWRVIADFRREYQINLTDDNLQMHWWDFWSLFRGLCDTSNSMNVIAIRGATPDPKMSSEEKNELRKRQEAVMLPPRTKEEAEKIGNFLWGF